MKSISSEEFRISHSRFMTLMIARKGFWWIFTFFLLLGLSAVFGIFLDMRFFIVALMIIFILAPMMMFYLYFSIGTTRENAPNILPHRLILESEGITIEVFVAGDDESEGRTALFSYPAERIGNYSLYGDGFLIPIKGKEGKAGIVLLPYSALPSKELIEEASSILEEFVRRNREL